MMIRTRFAPSPTGYLHIGGARTALFSWAYARRHGGQFVLRIEDTDIERSTRASVDAIIESMRWLGLDWDEGPHFQMQRIERYRAVADQLVAAGHAYPCWASREELDAMREAQRERGEKPRYDGRWRPERARAEGRTPPSDRAPVIRFRTPSEGSVGWNDLVKGPVVFPNEELDDLVILRADGVPTYNFGVVVDDLDMGITHVIRGDDHVNNTPRQIHIFNALAGPLPQFGHVPMILGADGERLSKRHGAVSVMQYEVQGYLPEALLNYLARLGWSHGDAEKFSLDQFVEWFDLEHVSRAAAQFDPQKLRWLNHQYMKTADPERLAALAVPRIRRLGGSLQNGPDPVRVAALLRDRAETVDALAEAAMMFYGEHAPDPQLLEMQLTAATRPALAELVARLAVLGRWVEADIDATLRTVIAAHGLKMPAVAVPVRLMVFGLTQTPSLGAVLELAGRQRTLSRLERHLAA